MPATPRHSASPSVRHRRRVLDAHDQLALAAVAVHAGVRVEGAIGRRRRRVLRELVRSRAP